MKSIVNLTLWTFFTILFISNFTGCYESKQSRYYKLIENADSCLIKKDYKKAIRFLKEAVKIQGDDPQIYKKIGKAFSALSEFTEAEQYFIKAFNLRDSDLDLLIEIGKIRLQFEDIESAKKIWERLEESYKDKPIAKIFYADMLFLEKKYKKAEEFYKEALKLDPKHQNGLIKLAICLEIEGKNDEASNFVDELEKLEPNSTTVLLEIALFYRLKNKLDLAEKYYKKVINQEPYVVAHKIEMLDLYAKVSESEKLNELFAIIYENKDVSRKDKIFIAEMLMSYKQMEYSKRIIEQISKENNKSIEIALLQGKYYLMMGQPAIAAVYYSNVLAINPRLPVCHYMLGVSYLLSGQDKLALRSLIQALTLDNDFVDAELALSLYYYRKKEFEYATKYANRVFLKNKHNLRALIILACISIEQKKISDANSLLNDAELIDGNNITVKYYKGVVNELAGRNKDALNIYKGILNENNQYIDVNKRYADLLVRSGQVEEATEYFSHYPNITDNNGYIYYVLGTLYESVGRMDQAIDAYLSSIENNDQLVLSYLALIKIYEQLKEKEKLKKLCEEAIKRVDGFISGYIKLSIIYASEKRNDKAIKLLSDAIKLDPENSILSNNLALLYLEEDPLSNEAFELAKVAYQKEPDNIAYADTLGWAYCNRGLFSTAIWYFNDAIKKSKKECISALEGRIKSNIDNETQLINKSGLSIIYYHLGFALFYEGKRIEAKDKLETALQCGLTEDLLKEAQNLLQNIGGQ